MCGKWLSYSYGIGDDFLQRCVQAEPEESQARDSTPEAADGPRAKCLFGW